VSGVAGFGPQASIVSMSICNQRLPSIAAAVAFFAAVGCGSTRASPAGASEAKGDDQELLARLAEQTHRLDELETRISLLEAEARSTRKDDKPEVRSGETIRLGMDKQLVAAPPASVREAPAIEQNEPVLPAKRLPQLRLYGRQNQDAGELPSVPVVSETLPVAPLPDQHGRTSAANGGEAVNQAYRLALRRLRERDFDGALAALSAFIEQNPGHALRQNAMYWRAEARYAKRDYSGALAEFEILSQRFPSAEKAPDALLKAAYCLRHLGNEDRARAALRRLRESYPNSQAAGVAAKEGST
jgi:tol-pal system protein YbgF